VCGGGGLLHVCVLFVMISHWTADCLHSQLLNFLSCTLTHTHTQVYAHTHTHTGICTHTHAHTPLGVFAILFSHLSRDAPRLVGVPLE